MGFVVWDCEDLFVRTADGAFIKVDLKTFCDVCWYLIEIQKGGLREYHQH